MLLWLYNKDSQDPNEISCKLLQMTNAAKMQHDTAGSEVFLILINLFY